MDIKDSYLHGTVGVVKSISVAADKLTYNLADINNTAKTITLPLATTIANGLMSKDDKIAINSLGNYVTLNTDLKITSIKTFTKQLKFTVAEGTSPFLVTSKTAVTNLNADLLDGYHSTSYLPYTAYNMDLGCLVKTDIPTNSNTMITFIIEGNSYSYNSIFTTGEFYNYTDVDRILNYGAYHHGYNFGHIIVFCYNGYVYMWFKQSSSFLSFVVTVYGTNNGSNNINRVTSITNAALPTTGITRKVEITPRISLNSSNYTSYIKESNFPGLNKTGTVTSVAIANGGGLSVTGSPITTSGTITITNTGVRSIATGTTNGTISVNTNGTSANVAVKGLRSAAYKEISNFLEITNSKETATDANTISKNVIDHNYSWNNTPYNNIGSLFNIFYQPDWKSLLFFLHGWDKIYFRSYNGSNKAWSAWRNIAFTDSNITGNAASADKLKTKRKLWGLDFDGTADVSGAMTGVGTINDIFNINKASSGAAILNVVETSASINYIHLYVSSTNTVAAKSRPLVLQNDYGNVGIGVIAPTLKLEVNGNVKATSFIGNLDGTYINKLTNYQKATAIGSITTTDSLNTALGKLEFKTDFIYNDLFGTDNDDVINKWHEIVDFIDSVKEGTDITDEFVTRKTDLTITGVKTFSTGPILANNATITLNLYSTNNYTAVVKWLKEGTSLETYNPLIGLHNTGGDGTGSICILPYPTETSPLGGTVGLFISKGALKLDGLTVIHSGNISSQSVEHANSADSTEYLNNYTISDPNTEALKDNKVKWFARINNSSGYAGNNYGFPTTNNANGILYLGTHPGKWGHQLGFSSDGNIYHRRQHGTDFSLIANGGSWATLLTSKNYTSYLDSRYYTETEADNRFVNVTGDTMTGPITLTSGSASAMDKTALSFISKSGAELARIGTNIGGILGLYAVNDIVIRPNSNFSDSPTLGIVLSKTKFTYNTYPVLHSNNYVNYITPSYILEKLKIVDGVGSKLDADLLDGKHASTFVEKITGTGSAVFIQNRVFQWDGALITTPFTWSNPNTASMFAFTIRIYINYRYTDLVISGYCFGDKKWLNPKCFIIGGNETYEVKFGWFDTEDSAGAKHLYVWFGKGKDSNNNVIKFGYGGFSIMNVHAGNNNINVYQGWQATNTSPDDLTNVQNSTIPDFGKSDYAITADKSDYAITADKLTSSAGSAALPIYFSNGKPIACTASSVFSDLSNSGNNLSVTVAGLNRTLTVNYAKSADKSNYLTSRYIGSNGDTVAQVKLKILDSYTSLKGVQGYSILVNSSFMMCYSLDDYIILPNGIYSLTYLTPGYDGKGFGQWLAACSGSDRLYVFGRFSNLWTERKTIAWTSDIPTALKNPYTLTFSAGTFAAKTYDGSSAVTVNIPTHTSHLVNNSGFLTLHLSLDNYVTLNTALTITNCKIFKINAPEDDREAVYYNIGLGLSSYGNNHKKVAAIGMGNEPKEWYKAAIGFERTGSYDAGDIVLLFNNRFDNTTCVYSDIKVRINANGNINTLGSISASGFIKTNSSDSYILLGGGGHKELSSITASKLNSITVVNAKAFSLSNASWIDTGYTFASITTGTYAVQITSGTDLVASGIMSVYKNLSDTAGDEIPLHVYGTAGWRPYLRTYANKLLISSNDTSTTSRTVTIKIALIL